MVTSIKTDKIQIIECPRDAMQGIHAFIPTALKIEYLNKLLSVGFHTLDFGSFVSPKVIPQLKDTIEIVDKLNYSVQGTQLLSIVANYKGATIATQFEQIKFVGFPLSLSETFQLNNTNKTISQAFEEVESIQNLLLKNNKIMVIYLSMGFGNPYGDPFERDYINNFVERLAAMEIKTICPSDTIGIASPATILDVFSNLHENFPNLTFGAHLHATSNHVHAKINAALQGGCIRIDGALKGFGGCPLAQDDLVGNIPTEAIHQYCLQEGIITNINQQALNEALEFAESLFKSK